jgi:type VI secretion system protein ImpM
MDASLPARIGYYGKLPAVGDFVCARLPEAFVEPWHLAMQALGQPASLATADTASIWNFICAPGLLGVAGWAGVMGPSRDRVGRGFPLALAWPLDGGPVKVSAAAALLREAVEHAWPPQRLRQACDALAQVTAQVGPSPDIVPGHGGSLWWNSAQTPATPGLALEGLPHAGHAAVLWQEAGAAAPGQAGRDP